MDMINKITALSTGTSKKFVDFQRICILDYSLIVNSLYQVTFGFEKSCGDMAPQIELSQIMGLISETAL